VQLGVRDGVVYPRFSQTGPRQFKAQAHVRAKGLHVDVQDPSSENVVGYSSANASHSASAHVSPLLSPSGRLVPGRPSTSQREAQLIDAVRPCSSTGHAGYS
jgi:hypothetical protein